MPLAENVPAIQAIKEAIEPRIIGQLISGFRAVAIEPGLYPGQETKWHLWSVEGLLYDEPDLPWSCGLSNFIPVSELQELFEEYFGDAAK